MDRANPKRQIHIDFFDLLNYSPNLSYLPKYRRVHMVGLDAGLYLACSKSENYAHYLQLKY